MSPCSTPVSKRSFGSSLPALWLFFLILLQPGISVAAAKVQIAKAAWTAKTHMLTVKGTCPGTMPGMPVELYDSSGRLLAAGTSNSRHRFTFKVADERPELLCSVRVKTGALNATKPVTGTHNKDCLKAPQCQILSPANGMALTANRDVLFRAKAKLKDRKAGPLKLEWDFGGGAMGEEISGSSPVASYKRPDTANTTVRFVRDKSRYRVRFTAMDAQKRYCEDAVEVTVGTPPAGLPPKVAEQAAPKLANELDGVKDDLVVLPYEEWTMQSDHDTRILPDAYVSMSPTVHNLKSVVYKKDRQPRLLGSDQVQLNYSAASNPVDPAGAGSINSTSQNWPLNSDIRVASPLMSATVQKTDFWEKYLGRPADEKNPDYYMSSFWMAIGSTYPFSGLPEPTNPYPDEGYIIGRGKANELTGSFMPGKDNPYVDNKPQAFSHYDDTAGEFLAKLLPYTDVDDSGRVNPYPLARVQATRNGQVAATTDGVLSVSRDFHCRGCHAKGKIAANPNTPFTPAAFASSASGQWVARHDEYEYAATPTDKLTFHEAASDSLWDQEYAAMQNQASLHSFYNNDMLYNVVTKGAQRDADGKVRVDAPVRCIGCHSSGMASEPSNFNEGWWAMENFDTHSAAYDPLYSVAMHRFHGELQWNDAKTDILRDANGRFVRWDWKTRGRNTRTLFPVVDEQGNALPMEENCLKCHAGHREPQFRDRMYTAGRTCYDCHGDMLAVGEAFPKDYPHNQAKLGSTDLNDYRIMWFDEPDCGSCHVGDGNVGKDGARGFYSAGVMKRAFDDSDLSATPRPVDRNRPNAARFSAAPLQNYQTSIPSTVSAWDPATDGFPSQDMLINVDAPLYRFGKDSHGNVPCAACHGSAHAIWPNRDPKANDNVTALQLQGHTGPILECNVCHSKDAFANLADLDGGKYSGLPENSGILGGPHGMHPMNDPNWWNQAHGDTTPISDGTYYGGWHDNVYRQPGRNGEDQCAACHGADHKGTRLSKTPVDLEFVVKNGKKAKWKAGEEVGCDRCHSVQKSFIGAPTGGGNAGGGGGPSNHAPVISSAPPRGLNISERYSYAVKASDADGDPLTYSLQNAPAGMTIDTATGVIAWTAPPTGGTFTFVVVVGDGKTTATQSVTLSVCTPPTKWDAMGMCM